MQWLNVQFKYLIFTLTIVLLITYHKDCVVMDIFTISVGTLIVSKILIEFILSIISFLSIEFLDKHSYL